MHAVEIGRLSVFASPFRPLQSGLDNYHTPWESWNVVVVKYMVNYINELDNGVRPLFLSSADDALEEPDWLQREV